MNRKQRRAANKRGPESAKRFKNNDEFNDGETVPQKSSSVVMELFAEGLKNHQAGHLPEAERCYRQILQIEARHCDSLHLLGVIAQQVGRNDIAVDLISRAIGINGQTASYHSNLGNALTALGHFDDAIAAYNAAISLDPNFAEAHFNLGIAAQNAQRPVDAVSAYQATLSLRPNFIEAYSNMGVALSALGRPEDAVDAFRAALRVKPDYAEAYSNLGSALMDLGRPEDALASYKAAIAIKPDYAEAHFNLGNALRTTGQLDYAVAVYEAALRIKPDYAEAHSNLGNTLKELGRLDESLVAYRQAIRIRPDYAEAHYNYGISLKELGRVDDAVNAYRAALRIKPNDAETHANLGNALRMLGRIDEAVSNYLSAVQIRPHFAEAQSNLGLALMDLGRLEEAVKAFTTALKIEPNSAETYSNMGNALKELGRLEEALAAYGSALQIKPESAEVLSNLGVTLMELGRLEDALTAYHGALSINPKHIEAHCNMGVVLKNLGRVDDAITAYEAALSINPEHPQANLNLGNALTDLGRIDEAIAAYSAALRAKPDYFEAHSNLLFCINYHPKLSSGDIFQAHRRWGARYGVIASSKHTNNRDPSRRLRVGYVSPDFRRHSVAHFLEPLLREHDRRQIEVYCYAEVPTPDFMTEQFKGLADHWRSTVGMPDNDLAKQIRADGVDILVDLAGHTAKNRLRVFASKPAPLQVSWLGYPNTTGLAAIDYRLVDSETDPEGEADMLAIERLLRLKDGFLCYRPPSNAPEPGDTPASRKGFVTFGSFNNPAKLSDPTLDAWAALLRAVPESRLLLKGLSFADASAQALFRKRMGERNVAPERLSLNAFTPDQFSHLALYADIDIALDPFPYNGTATTCEALWMGVPVVTISGDRHAARVGASLLTRLGLNALIARDVDQYIAIATDLAADFPRLSELRTRLRYQMAASSLCNAPAFARSVEAAFREIWAAWCVSRDDNALSSQTCTLIDGSKVIVPRSIDSITPYVLEEQQDWFEDELKFLRRLLLPGQKIIDIGANYGVYTFSMAQRVGPSGCVWAFEPASATARFLAEEIVANDFGHVFLERSALSNICGEAQLSINLNPETNSILRSGLTKDFSENITLDTLDNCMNRYNWQDISFIKIDAEGEEINILEGGKRFFNELSPLIQYEVKAGADFHFELVGQFASIGYSSYRLVPGLGVLVPFDENSSPDRYQLNLFCCKNDRAAILAARGYLLDAPAQSTESCSPMAALMDDEEADAYHWRKSIGRLPYGVQLKEAWERTMATMEDRRLHKALSLYLLSQDPTKIQAERFAALSKSLELLKVLCQEDPSRLRNATLARVAQDYGARSVAVSALQDLVKTILSANEVDANEPFLPAGRRFDLIPPKASLSDWALASAIEELERLQEFSSFYGGASSWERLKVIEKLGFGDEEMDRRLRLIERRFGTFE